MRTETAVQEPTAPPMPSPADFAAMIRTLTVAATTASGVVMILRALVEECGPITQAQAQEHTPCLAAIKQGAAAFFREAEEAQGTKDSCTRVMDWFLSYRRNLADMGKEAN